MSDPNWQVLKTAEVPARPKQGYWTLAVEYVNPSQRLKFAVEEIAAKSQPQQPQGGFTPAPAVITPTPPPTPSPSTSPPTATSPGSPVAVATSAPKWSYAPDRKCTADGDPKAPLNPATCLFADAPPGALIGKIGGSTAGKTDGTKLFVVGSYCVIELEDKAKGPLYLTMNCDPMSSLER